MPARVYYFWSLQVSPHVSPFLFSATMLPFSLRKYGVYIRASQCSVRNIANVRLAVWHFFLRKRQFGIIKDGKFKFYIYLEERRLSYHRPIDGFLGSSGAHK